MTGKIKGSLLLSRVKYLNAQDAGSKERVLARLPEADRAALGGMLLPSSWYPADLMVRLEAALAAALAQGDRTRFFLDMGRYSAQTNLGTQGVQRPYLREGEPHFLLRHVPRMYTAMHGSGRREYEQTGDRAATIRTFEAEESDAEACLTALGWLRRAIELSGGRDVRVVETQCRAKGAAHCEYRCEWT